MTQEQMLKQIEFMTKLLKQTPKEIIEQAKEMHKEEKMYSEEEVKKISLDFFYHWWNAKGNNTEEGFNEWFEQFKKQ
jgi:hypothetical protein